MKGVSREPDINERRGLTASNLSLKEAPAIRVSPSGKAAVFGTAILGSNPSTRIKRSGVKASLLFISRAKKTWTSREVHAISMRRDGDDRFSTERSGCVEKGHKERSF